jgi:hypothetical protein
MLRYIQHIIDDMNIYINNVICPDKKYPRNSIDLYESSACNVCNNVLIDDKQLRIDTLLFVRQFKNTYYKYTNKDKFNIDLYNSFIDDKNFDGGLTAFDDDDYANEENKVRIFDKYIFEYIKNRNDVITYLQCKNKDVVVRSNLEQLGDFKNGRYDIVFAIDISEKELFNYCYTILQESSSDVGMIRNIIFSMIFKYEGKYKRIKLSSMMTRQKDTHPYIILERLLGP